MIRSIVLAACAGVISWDGQPADVGIWLGIITMCLQARPQIWLFAYGAAISSTVACSAMKIVVVSITTAIAADHLNTCSPDSTTHSEQS